MSTLSDPSLPSHVAPADPLPQTELALATGLTPRSLLRHTFTTIRARWPMLLVLGVALVLFRAALGWLLTKGWSAVSPGSYRDQLGESSLDRAWRFAFTFVGPVAHTIGFALFALVAARVVIGQLDDRAGRNRPVVTARYGAALGAALIVTLLLLLPAQLTLYSMLNDGLGRALSVGALQLVFSLLLAATLGFAASAAAATPAPVSVLSESTSLVSRHGWRVVVPLVVVAIAPSWLITMGDWIELRSIRDDPTIPNWQWASLVGHSIAALFGIVATTCTYWTLRTWRDAPPPPTSALGGQPHEHGLDPRV